MSQPSVASFFHSRKRTAIDDIYAAKNKVTALEAQHDNLAAVAKASSHSRAGTPMECGDNNAPAATASTTATTIALSTADVAPLSAPTTRSGRRTPVPAPTPTAATTRPRRCLKPADSAAKKAAGAAATANAPQQQKIVKFTLAGHLSPKKKMQSDAARLARADCTGTTTAASAAVALFSERSSNVERGLKTPTKAEQKARFAADQAAEVRSKLSLDEIRARVTRSSRLSEMKASMEKLAALQEQRDRIISTRKSTMKTADKHNNADSQTDRAAKILGKSLKQFDTIELEVLSSPQKGLNTPTKQQTVPASPGGGTSNIDELMSPKKTATPRRLFSPSKTATGSPTRCAGGSPAAYERFKALREAGRPALTLPYKYRCLAETFKCVDTVCSMFFNRPEAITMKKLCPAVKRLLRRDIGESDLGQILAVFPDAYNYKHKKMLNAGSHTKYEYYQLVLTPNVPAAGAAASITSAGRDEVNIIRAGQQQKMNPQMIIDRQQRFNQLLLERVKDEHDQFLRQLDQPIVVPKDKITSWHPKFELERCADVLPATLPQPPNVEKFSCARDILATARNLFNCATPMERVMQRVGDKLAERQRAQEELQQQQPPPQAAQHHNPTKTVGSQLSAGTDTESEPPTPTSTRTGQTTAGLSAADPVSALLKGVPKSLLERIRAKQAARELDAMTRRPSQDKEAGKYERLPELARYLRNIFVTESRNVLKIEIVLAKLENSYRERLPKDRMKELLQLIGSEVPNQWLTFPHIADVHYVKIKKDVPLGEVIAVLERRAAEMA